MKTTSADHGGPTSAPKQVGVWLDHRQAVVVGLRGEEPIVTVIPSEVEKHAERSGDSPLHGDHEARQVPADDSRQRDLTGKLNGYYDRVAVALHGYTRIFIFGPGEAKGELKARLVHKHLGDHVAALETTDYLTHPQIVAKVRGYFGVGAPRVQTPGR